MSEPSDPIDEVTSMFLTHANAVAAPEAETAVLELLIMGHLPVRAHVWLPPYASEIAREVGPTALIRLDSSEPGLLIVGGDDFVPSAELFRNVREAILGVGAHIRTWLVSLPVQAGYDRVLRAQPERITILSGADDLAVTEAYRLLKALDAASQVAATELPRLGLAVMGAGRDEAADAARRINGIATELLGTPVPLVACVPKIDAPPPSTGWYQFPGIAQPELDDISIWIRETRPRPAGAASPAASGAPPVTDSLSAAVEKSAAGMAVADEREVPVPVVEREVMLPPTRRRASAEPGQALDFSQTPLSTTSVPPVTKPPGRVAAPQAEADGPPEPVKLAPKAATGVEAKPPATPPAPGVEREPPALARYVSELAPLPARCPGHDAIELAVDRDGMVHLLGREPTLREMHHVASWVRRHRGLLAQACPDQVFADEMKVVWHLFTDDPLRVTDLYESGLHLHLLVPVDVEGRKGWYAAPLNRPAT